jgi:hypothetical protein
VTAEEIVPFVWGGVALAGGYVLVNLWRAGRLLARRRWVSAWRVSAKLMGWLPPLGALLLAGALAAFAPQVSPIDLPQFDPVRAAATLLPVIAGCHFAFAFSPADEAALEGLLAAPRPLAWVLCERAALLALPYALIAVAANALALVRFPEVSPAFFFRWLPPFLFFAAVAVMVTVTSRQAALGMTLTIVLWTGLAFMGAGLLARWPHLWFVHIYLQPEQALSPAAFSLHQVWVSLAALAMFVRAAGQLGNAGKLMAALGT